MKAENANNPPVEVVLKTRLDAPERFEIPAQSDFDRWAAAALDAGFGLDSAAGPDTDTRGKAGADVRTTAAGVNSNTNSGVNGKTQASVAKAVVSDADSDLGLNSDIAADADPGVAGEAGIAASPQPLEVCVVVIDADESAALNRRHFDRSKPTNVLAFPCDAPLPPDGGEAKPLGDVLITAPVVEAEAREQGKRPAAHWAHLFVHAMLHLQGYDHAEDDEAARMEAREITILGRLGFPNPYQPQTSGQSQTFGQPQTFSRSQPPAQPQTSGQPPGRSSDA